MSVVERCAAGAMALLLGVAIVSCGDDTPPEPLRAEQLAARLVAPGDLDGEWAVDEGPDGIALNGVVTDEMRPMLPTFDLCEAASAESRAAAEAVEWQAFTQLDRTVDDPLDPPSDRSGRIVFVQEFLAAGPESDIDSTFDLVRAGWEACLGDVPAGEEGPGTVSAFSLPDVGDERTGTLTTLGEAGGWAEWRVHSVLVRSGATLLALTVADVHSNDVEAQYTDDEVGAIVRTIVDGLADG